MGTAPLEFFTICARNYAAHAATLAESIRKQHPGSRVSVWLLAEGPIPGCLSNIETHDVREYLPPKTYAKLRLCYDVVEFCTAIKPFIFQQLFANGSDRVVFLDPDIYLFNPLEDVDRLFDENAIGVLTPHSLTPLPPSDGGTDDFVFLQSGVFNLGFCALRKSERTDEFLDWWWGWLQTHASRDLRTGLFTDQKWLGLVPAYWPEIAVSRDPALNAAFWNLHERSLGKDATGKWTVAGKELGFFHFSGYDPKVPDRLTKYEHQKRYIPTRGSLLRELLDFYASRLQANGISNVPEITYLPFGFSDGILPDPVAIEIAKDLVDLGEDVEKLNLIAHLSDVAPKATYPRYIEKLFQMRPDVSIAFKGQNSESIVNWMLEYGVAELKLNKHFINALRTHKSRSNSGSKIPILSRIGRKLTRTELS